MGSIALSADLDALHDREWDRLARAGTWFSAAERLAIAHAARDATVTTPAQAAAHRIYEQPAAIRREWLADLEADGLTLSEYVEVVGVVARLRALDTLLFGAGHPPRRLPAAATDAPPTRLAVDATIDGAWVPTVGVAFPPTVLSSVPAENEAMHDAHAALYLSATPDADGFSMGNMGVVRDGITRSQMEFVAARTSLLNDCFY